MKPFLLFLSLVISAPANAGGAEKFQSQIFTAVQANQGCLSGASDKEAFCGMNINDEKCLTAVIMAIIDLESGGNPGTTFNESQYQKGMSDSVGLMQLSKGECPEAPSEESLKNPDSNIKCGVRKFCELVKKDSVIAGGDDKGASKYWSVLRTPRNLSGSNGGIINVGKLKKVQDLTKQYAGKIQ